MQEAAVAIAGQGQSFSNALGELEPTFTEFDKLFRVLDTQRLAVGQLFRNGAVTFRALRGREGQLASLIRNSNEVFQTTAARDRDIEALFRAFPTFQDESRLTFDRLKPFALNADPLFRQLVPAAEQLSPTLIAFSQPRAGGEGLLRRPRNGDRPRPQRLPRPAQVLPRRLPVLLRALDPFLRNLNPILTGLGLYKNEITALMGNVAAATNAVHLSAQGKQIHYLRALGPFGPESLATYPNRLTTNRNSAYSQPWRLRRPGLGPAQLRYPPVQLRDHGDARLEHAQRSRLQRTATGGDVDQSEGLLRTAQALRLRRTGQARPRSRPRVAAQQAPFAADLRQRAGDDLPAHLRTGQIEPLPTEHEKGRP